MQVFENSIWLFFTHPFDVGDVIMYEGTRYTVANIKMQFVILSQVSGELVTVPTSVMTTALVHNVTRCAVSHRVFSTTCVLLMWELGGSDLAGDWLLEFPTVGLVKNGSAASLSAMPSSCAHLRVHIHTLTAGTPHCATPPPNAQAAVQV